MPLAVFQCHSFRENPSTGSKDQTGLTGAATPKARWFHDYKTSEESAPTTKDQTLGGHVRATAMCTVASNNMWALNAEPASCHDSGA